MKKALIFIFLFTSAFGYAQTNITFNKYLAPFQGATTISSLIKTDSNYFALVGQKSLVTYRQNFGMLKFNLYGQIIDSSFIHVNNQYYGSDTPYGHGFILTSDSCFLYCGGVKDTMGWVSGFLVKFDYNMDTLWTKIIYHPDTAASLQKPTTSVMHLTDIKETPNGNYILTANYNSNADGYEDRSFLLKLDTSGNVIWQKRNPSNITIIDDIEIDPVDSGYYFPAGRSVNAPLNISIFKTNSLGDVLWDKVVNHTHIGQYPLDIELINDSVLMVVSGRFIKVPENNSWREAVIITKVNTSNQINIWEKQYEFAYTREDRTLKQSIGANLAQNGNIAISATIVVPHSNDSRGTVLLINQNGDSLWQRYYAHNWNDSSNVDMQLNDLVVCDDGGFLFGGFVEIHGFSYAKSWLVKTDSMGMTQAAFTLGIEGDALVIKKQKPLLYPNPATDNFRLRFEQSPTAAMQLSIYNSAGQMIKQQQLTAFGNEYRVDIRDLKAGVYFVKLESENGEVFSSKFIKQ